MIRVVEARRGPWTQGQEPSHLEMPFVTGISRLIAVHAQTMGGLESPSPIAGSGLLGMMGMTFWLAPAEALLAERG
jgi:hypothetical protein